MTKFLIMVVTVLTLGFTTNCGDNQSDVAVCGDGSCSLYLGESCDTCPEDCNDFCPDPCGNGFCEFSSFSNESCSTCSADCGFCEETCGGGWLDEMTGLCWQDPQRPSEEHGRDDWTLDEATNYCANLSLGGHGPGEWRLPTISELRSLVRGCNATASDGACLVTDSCATCSCLCGTATDSDPCEGCGSPPAGQPYFWPAGMLPGWFTRYLSSSHDEAGNVWTLSFHDAAVTACSGGCMAGIRCVRPGP